MLHQSFACRRVVEFVVGEFALASVTVENGLNERCLVEVFALVLIFVNPQFGEHTLNVDRHQSRKNGIARILRGCWENGGVEFLLFHVEIFVEEWADGFPLVESEIINHDKAHLLTSVDKWEDLRFKYFITHQRVFAPGDPRFVVAFHHFGECIVRLLLLHFQHFAHAGVGVREGEFPSHQSLVEFIPIFDVACHGNLIADSCKFLPIIVGGFLCHQRLAVQILFDRKQNLHRVNRFNQIVGNFATDGLIHDIFLLAFGDHNHRHIRLADFDFAQCFQPADARHVFVENNEAERLL